MNIFYLHHCPARSASMLCDKHVVKMILESAQMLSTAQRLLGNDHEDLYRVAYKNHPSTVWVRSDKRAYEWTYKNWQYMLSEYTQRYGKHHASGRLQRLLSETPQDIADVGYWIDPPLCMPEEFKRQETAIGAYREYYKSKPFKMAYTKRQRPSWLPVRKIDI